MCMVSHTASYNKEAFTCRMVRPSLRSLPQISRITFLVIPHETIYAYATISVARSSTLATFTPPRIKA